MPFRERREPVHGGSLSNVLFSRVPEGRRALRRLAVIFHAMGSTEPPPPPTLVHRCSYPERFRYLEAELCGCLPGPFLAGMPKTGAPMDGLSDPGRHPRRSASRLKASSIDFTLKRDEPISELYNEMIAIFNG